MDGLTTALVGGLAGGSVAAIIAAIVTLRAQARQHVHERDLAQEARLQERRATAYVDILEYCVRIDMWVSRTEPAMTPAPEPPKLVPEDELIRLNAITSAHASDEVQALSAAFSAAVRTFEAAVSVFHSERDYEPHGDETIKARAAMYHAKDAVHVALENLSKQVADELRGVR